MSFVSLSRETTLSSGISNGMMSFCIKCGGFEERKKAVSLLADADIVNISVKILSANRWVTGGGMV
jgi:hypothetical protein